MVGSRLRRLVGIIEGLSPTALMKFGSALHIITDRLSPAHVGYQPWYGQSSWNPSAWLHFFHEANRWHPNVNAAVQAARNAFQETFGMQWDEFILMQLQTQRLREVGKRRILSPCGSGSGVLVQTQDTAPQLSGVEQAFASTAKETRHPTRRHACFQAFPRFISRAKRDTTRNH